MSYRTSYTSFITAFALLFAVVSASVLTGCDSTVNQEGDPPPPPQEQPQPFDATGTISGRVIDRVTDAPIEGATVRIDLADSLAATTGAGGSFAFNGVPANKSDETAGAKGTYNIHVSTPDGSPYRDFYTAEVELVFDRDEGTPGNTANNLTASVTFELAKLNGTINGALTVLSDFSDEPVGIPGQELILFQTDFRTSAEDADEGTPEETSEVRLATTTTADDGSFSFESVEEDAEFRLDLVLPNGSKASGISTGDTPPLLDPSTGGSTLGLGDIDIGTTNATIDADDFAPPLDASFAEGFEDGTSLDTADPEIVIDFSEPVAQNDYTVPNPDAVDDNIAKDFTILKEADPTVNFARTDDGDILFTPSWNDDFTQLTLSASETLPDGFTYKADLSALDSPEKGLVTAAFEQGFERDGNGPVISLEEALNGSLTDVSFSVGVNQEVPAAPQVTFATGDGEQVDQDYSDPFAAQDIAITADGQEGLVAGYEVFVIDGKTENVSPLDEDSLPDAPDYKLDVDDDISGEILETITAPGDDEIRALGFAPRSGETLVDVLEDIVDPNGTRPVSEEELDNVFFPFQNPGDGYTPVEILVRAVSINGVPSETVSLTVGDNVAPNLDGATTDRTDGGVTITVTYGEIYNVGSVDAADFTIAPVVGEAPTVSAVEAQLGGTEVTLVLSDPLVGPAALQVEGQTDLAGNDIAANEDEAFEIQGITDDIAPSVTQVAAVADGDTIKVTFNEPIDPASLDEADFKLNGDIVLDAVPGENPDGTEVLLQIDGDALPNPGALDQLVIESNGQDAGVGPTDLVGNALADEFTSEEIVDEAPLDIDEFVVNSDQLVTVTYLEPVDAETVDAGDYTLLDGNGEDVLEGQDVTIGFEFKDEGATVEILFFRGDPTGTVEIQVKEQADLAGNDIAADEEDNFEVSPN